MRILYIIVAVVSLSMLIYYEYQVAKKGYPASPKWYLLFTVTGFIVGFGGFLALVPQFGLPEYLFAVGTGVMMALIFTLLFPLYLKWVIRAQK